MSSDPPVSTEHRAIIDGKLYERNFDWGPLCAVSAEDLTARVLNFERLLKGRDAELKTLRERCERQKRIICEAELALCRAHEKLTELGFVGWTDCDFSADCPTCSCAPGSWGQSGS